VAFYLLMQCGDAGAKLTMGEVIGIEMVAFKNQGINEQLPRNVEMYIICRGFRDVIDRKSVSRESGFAFNCGGPL